MGTRVFRMDWRVPVVLASACALLLAGFAAGMAVRGALAQPSSEVIHACKGNRSGAIRIVDGPSECARSETAMSWNVQGPPAGPSGGFVRETETGNLDEFFLNEAATFQLQCSSEGQEVVWAWPISTTTEGNDLLLDIVYNDISQGVWMLTLVNHDVDATSVDYSIGYWCVDAA